MRTGHTGAAATFAAVMVVGLSAAACTPAGSGSASESGPASGSSAVVSGGSAAGTVADTTHPTAAARASAGRPFAAPATPSSSTPIVVTSTTFTSGAALPITTAFSGCGGKNGSPQLSWSGAPAATQSFVVTLFDPDAPTSTGFWHWTVFDIPATAASLASGAGSGASPVKGSQSGYTDFGFSHYGGPCPPKGDQPHHYIFTVYALDVPTIKGLSPQSTAAYLMFSMRGHLLAQGSLEGLFAQ
jgi:Raf kinase inhibitor-like YbhB/YbcL family protein